MDSIAIISLAGIVSSFNTTYFSSNMVQHLQYHNVSPQTTHFQLPADCESPIPTLDPTFISTTNSIQTLDYKRTRGKRAGRKKQRDIKIISSRRPTPLSHNRGVDHSNLVVLTHPSHCDYQTKEGQVQQKKRQKESSSPANTDECSSSRLNYTSNEMNTNCEQSNPCHLDELRTIREKTRTKFRMCHLNINSLRFKFQEIRPILDDKLTDFLTICETKIDDTFNDALFEVNGYKLQRKDRNKNGGGIATWIRSDLIARRRPDLEDREMENITYEINLDGSTFLVYSVYRPPSTQSDQFLDRLNLLIDKGIEETDNVVIIGDLNYDMNCDTKSKDLKDFCDIFNLDNLVSDSTCYKSDENPSSIDVILTNRTDMCDEIVNFNTGVSDFHNLLSTCIKKNTPDLKENKKVYRSFRKFDQEAYQSDLSNQIQINNHELKPDSDVNDMYEHLVTNILNVANKHAPFKESKRKNRNDLPYINAPLKKAIYTKRMAQNKYRKEKNNSNWIQFKNSRNRVTKLKKQSIRKYFLDRCVGGQRNKNFWPTIKPFLSKKNKSGQQKINLAKDEKIINNPFEVCSTFNDFFVNVAKDIGKDIDFEPHSHPSLKAIKEHYDNVTEFEFKEIDPETVAKTIKRLDDKKATGEDTISCKILKASAPIILEQLSDIINNSIRTGCFPHKLKLAQVVPLFKKNDPLDVKNYRPVSILPLMSKIIEKILSQQLSDHFESIFNDFLCAFRKKHGCQTILLRLIEDWKKALDSKQYVAAVLMDLSKAFDCLPHELLVQKLSAYGVGSKAVRLIENYLSNRKQQVKLDGHVSGWEELAKGVPQGSILGPLLFNIFINDIFLFINEAELYNYADDNTLSYSHKNFDTLINVLEQESQILIDWFHFNFMQANPDKFQALALGNRTFNKTPILNIQSTTLACDASVRLLGVDIDHELKFSSHIGNLCRKASQQLNVLKRIGKHLSKLNKLTIFHTFILSNFNFCPMTWHFCSKTNSKKMEKIQERALRFIYHDYSSSYEELLTKAKVPSLETKRKRILATETFKILNGMSPNCLQPLVSFKERKYDLRHNFSANIPSVKSTYFGLKSFRYAAAVMWNSLPEQLRNAKDLNTFTSLISNWQG